MEVVCGRCDEIELDAARAVNVALITSEAITNALKHAFPRVEPARSLSIVEPLASLEYYPFETTASARRKARATKRWG